MRRLVALDLPGGPAFLEALVECFEAGDAVLPVDQRLPLPARASLFAELAPSLVIDAEGRHELEGGRPVEEGDALVVPTSGSSGRPKGVVLTHDAIAASGAATSKRLGIDPVTDRWLCCLPLSHVGGLSVLTRAIATGTAVEVHPRFDEAEVQAALARGATRTSFVPTMLWRLDPALAASFTTIVLGGSAPPVELPVNVVTTYGLTETGSGVVYDGVPLEGVEVEIREDGEIALRAPMLLRAYRDGRDPKDERGFFPTGDLGAIGEDGLLKVFGRREDVIVSGGEKIWPTPVEAVLARHPAVAEVVLVGVPDPEWQAAAVACVVARPGGQVRLEDLRSMVRDELGSLYAPRGLVLVDSIPRTSIGKVRRGELAEIAAGAAAR